MRFALLALAAALLATPMAAAEEGRCLATSSSGGVTLNAYHCVSWSPVRDAGDALCSLVECGVELRP